jgi:ABC-type glutathione transport system ATPase component
LAWQAPAAARRQAAPTEKIFGNPQHDYTRMLLSAVPELHKKWQHSPLGAESLAVPAGVPAAAVAEDGVTAANGAAASA